MRVAKAFLRFWYDFVVGEDWRIAAGIVGVLSAGAPLVAGDVLPDGAIAIAVATAIVLVVVTSIVGAALSTRR